MEDVLKGHADEVGRVHDMVVGIMKYFPRVGSQLLPKTRGSPPQAHLLSAHHGCQLVTVG